MNKILNYIEELGEGKYQCYKTQKRNIHLAKVFYDLHLMEAEGSGFDLMYETLLMAGKNKPIVVEGDDFVEVSVYRKIITKDAARLSDYISTHYRLKRKSIIALGIILQKRSLYASELTNELQLTEQDRLRSYVEPLLTNDIINSKGVGKGTKYEISPLFLNKSKFQSPTTLKTIEPYRLKALILEDLRFYPNSSIAEIANRLPDVEYNDLEKMVRKMAQEGEIVPIGGRKYRKYSVK